MSLSSLIPQNPTIVLCEDGKLRVGSDPTPVVLTPKPEVKK